MDERQLVNDCLRGKLKAQKDLYARFSQPMMGVCYRYTKSIEDAEDVLQEGFVKLFRSLHQYKFEGDLGAWIRKIMVNTALNFLKKNKRYKSEMLFVEPPIQIATGYNPDLILNAKEVARLLRELPPGYQIIFNLYAIEGFSHVEIGEMLGISDGTSRSQYARARALLIKWIEKESIEFKNESYANR